MLGMLIIGPAKASHTTNHVHSVAYELTVGYDMSGVRVTRPDNNPGGVELDGCSVPFNGSPVYQTQWVIINSAATNWVEGGTASQCAGNYRYHYWGYGYNGNWFGNVALLLTSDFPTLHTYTLNKPTVNNRWTFYKDGGILGQAVEWNARGIASAGLESYSPNAAVGKHQYGNMQFLWNGVWNSWAGRDDEFVSPNNGMCGRWSSTVGNDRFWYAAQNRAC